MLKVKVANSLGFLMIIISFQRHLKMIAEKKSLVLQQLQIFIVHFFAPNLKIDFVGKIILGLEENWGIVTFIFFSNQDFYETVHQCC